MPAATPEASKPAAAEPTSSTPDVSQVSRVTLSYRGQPLDLELTSDGGTLRTEEPWSLHYRITNRGTRSIYIVDGGDYRNPMGRPESYKISARRDGHDVPGISIDQGMQMGGLMGPHAIEPGKTYEQRLLVARWVDVKDPGRYSFTVAKELMLGDGNIDNVDYQKLDKLPTTVSVGVQIVASTHDTMGVLIDALGAQMQNNGQEAFDAANTLDFVTDERAIARYAQVVDTWSRSEAKDADQHFSVTLESIHALRKWGTESARTPLVSALASKNPTFHLAAAQSLSAQKTPASVAALWTLRNDPDEGVRITVVQAIAALNGNDTSAKLREMSHDKSKTVADEAKRLLH